MPTVTLTAADGHHVATDDPFVVQLVAEFMQASTRDAVAKTASAPSVVSVEALPLRGS